MHFHILSLFNLYLLKIIFASKSAFIQVIFMCSSDKFQKPHFNDGFGVVFLKCLCVQI